MAADEEHHLLTEDEVNSLLEPPSSSSDTDKIKILVAEDNRTTKLLYDKGLFNEVFDKKIVISGKEALLVYNEWHPDILVLDIYLPEMTGYEVLKTIRTTTTDKKTTIVVATSLYGKEDVLSCMNLGIEGYIIKPFQCIEIGEKILSYYAKQEPERARKAEALCREIAKQSQAKLLLDKDRSKMQKDAEGARDGSSDPEIEESGGEKETGEIAEK
jgi:CheY-like chemotaxis protein